MSTVKGPLIRPILAVAHIMEGSLDLDGAGRPKPRASLFTAIGECHCWY